MNEQQDPVPTLRESSAFVITPIPEMTTGNQRAYYHQFVPVVVGDFFNSERRRTPDATTKKECSDAPNR